MKTIALIMAGGSGTRFWPKSSRKNPKQLLNLVSKKSLLQETSVRLTPLTKEQWVITTESLSNKIKKQLPKTKIISEPFGRNTMAAVCLGVWEILKKNQHCLVIVLPADAYIENEEKYRESLKQAVKIAEDQEKIVCLGIKPNFAATGYGYIQSGSSLRDGASAIEHFFEKPDSSKAQEYFQDPSFSWNAGIFVFRTDVFQKEVKEHAPEYFEAFEKLNKKNIKNLYSKLPSTPIDIALMEKTSQGAVIAGDFGWNDLGSWPTLSEILPANHAAGLVNTAADVLATHSENNIIDIQTKKFVSLIGLKDYIVVETKDCLMICHKNEAQKIKETVNHLEKNPKLKKELL